MRSDEGQLLSADGKRATGVTYIDANGEEWEQPADLVLLCAYGFFNVRLMLLSGIGKPYDRANNEGVVGRNYAYQTGSGATALLRERATSIRSPPPARSASQPTTSTATISTMARRASSAAPRITCAYTNGRPIHYHPTPPGTPAWGSAWKKARARDLPARDQRRRAGQRHELSRQLSSTSIRPTRTRSAGR